MYIFLFEHGKYPQLLELFTDIFAANDEDCKHTKLGPA